MTLEAGVPLAALAILCAAAAWLDLTRRRIPNWLCGLTAVGGLAAAAALGGLGGLGSHALHMLIGLAGGMALFALGGFGGGDAKFYAAAAAWFGLGQALTLLLSVALSGLVLLILWFSYRRARGIPLRPRKNGPLDGLPYGVAIAGGAIVTALV